MIEVKDTAGYAEWIDPEVTGKYPKGDKVLCLSKYGVATIGKFTPNFHIGWLPMPKMQPSIRAKLHGNQLVQIEHVAEDIGETD